MAEYVAQPGLQGSALNPLSVTYEAQITGINFQGGDQAVTDALASAILRSHESEIDAFVAGVRQLAHNLPLEQINQSLVFADMIVYYTSNQGVENLHIIAYPSPQPSPSNPSGFAGTFPVECQFTGYGVGSIETQGVYNWSAFNTIIGGVITDDDYPDAPIEWGPKGKVGKSGVCANKIMGQQYFEVLINLLPTTVPDPITKTMTKGVDDGTFLTWGAGDVNKLRFIYEFPQQLDTWLTPAIGFIPSQQYDDDWAQMGNVVVDDMLVGLEGDDTYTKARSIGLVPTSSMMTDLDEKYWINTAYWIKNPSTGGFSPRTNVTEKQVGTETTVVIDPYNEVPQGTFVTDVYETVVGPPFVMTPTDDDLFVIEPQILASEMNPILYANTTPKVTINFQTNQAHADPPQHAGDTRQDQACLAVGGKYLITPRGGSVNHMPADLITPGMVDAAIAAADDDYQQQKLQATTNKSGPLYPPPISPSGYFGYTYTGMYPAFWATASIPISLPVANQYTGDDEWIVMMTSMQLDDDYPTPLQYNSFNAVVPQFDDYLDVLYGQLYSKPGKFNSRDFGQVTLVGDYFESPTSNYPLNSATVALQFFNDDRSVAYGVDYEQAPEPPTGSNTLGFHSYVFKGRGDLLFDAGTPHDDAPIDQHYGAQILNGCWSGVDLGQLKVDDTIMIAVDADARKVWYGKNGKWYDKNGVATQTDQVPGDDDLLPAVLLDGDDKQDYYPAVTLRVGHSKVTFKFGSACKYPPPQPFKYYGAPPSSQDDDA